MALNPKSWALNTYSLSTWTTLVDAAVETMVKNVVASIGATNATVAMRIVGRYGDLVATIVPGETLDANLGYKVDLDLIVLEKFQKLQVRSSAAGVSFSANGVERGTGVWAVGKPILQPVAAGTATVTAP